MTKKRRFVAVVAASVGLGFAAAVVWVVALAPHRSGRSAMSGPQREAARRAETVGSAVDWPEIEEEAAAALQEWIRIPSVNPPGEERAAAAWLDARLRRQGLASEVLEFAPKRASVLARLPSAVVAPARRRPILLVHHLDVVPVEAEERWAHPPFSGVRQAGEVWGRGAIDDKGPGIMQLFALIALARSGARLDRDVFLVGVADEEEGGERGIRALLRERPALADAEIALVADGPFGVEVEGQRVLPVATAEKSELALRIVLEGKGGHASIPDAPQPLERLSAAMTRLVAARRPARFAPEVLETLARLGAHTPGARGWLLERMGWPGVGSALAPVLQRDPLMDATLRDTVVWTGMTAGLKYNVVPGRAEALLDVRIAPGSSAKATLDWATATLALPEAQIEVLAAEDPSRTDFRAGPWFGLVEAVAERRTPGTIVLPILMPAATDARHLRAAGVPAYVITPAFVGRERVQTAHGLDERIPVRALGEGARFFFELIVAAAGAPVAPSHAPEPPSAGAR